MLNVNHINRLLPNRSVKGLCKTQSYITLFFEMCWMFLINFSGSTVSLIVGLLVLSLTDIVSIVSEKNELHNMSVFLKSRACDFQKYNFYLFSIRIVDFWLIKKLRYSLSTKSVTVRKEFVDVFYFELCIIIQLAYLPLFVL